MRVKHFETTEATDIRALLGVDTFKRDIVSWQFGKPPNRCLTLVDDRGKVVGFNGSMPVTLTLNGRSAPAIWSCDFIVSEEARGQGLGKKLKTELQAKNGIVMALGISDMAAMVHGRLGWNNYDQPIYKLVRRNRISRNRDRLLRIFQRINAIRFLHKRNTGKGISITNMAISSNSVTQMASLWARCKDTWPAAVDRSSSYLFWRYADHPNATYQASIAYDQNNTPLAALIWRLADDQAQIVDYVGPRYAQDVKDSLVRQVLGLLAHCSSVTCTTSDIELRNAMLANGSYSARSKQIRFSLWQCGDFPQLAQLQWLIMGGDSDGELLDAAAVNSGARVCSFAFSQDKNVSQQWDILLQESSADRLFASRDWLQTWWDVFSREHQFEDRSIAQFDQTGRLIGVMPIYRYKPKLRAPLPIARLQFIGGNWQGPDAMRSEYLRPIIRQGAEREFLQATLAHMNRWTDWQDLVLADTPSEGTLQQLLSDMFAKLGVVRRPRYYRDLSYQIDCTGSLSSFKKQLSQSSRRRLYGSERRFRKKHGDFVLEFANSDNYTQYLVDMNNLHKLRWGKPVFEGARLEFISRVAKLFAKQGCLHLSRISWNGRPLSVMFNLEAGRCLYNIQSGFDESFDSKIPLGYMHIGLQVSQCFNSDIERLDLLAGKGKKTDFKSQFATPGTNLTVLQVVRPKWLGVVFRVRDLLQRNN